MAETRKLAAILAADVVGYSRLAGSAGFGAQQTPSEFPPAKISRQAL